MSDILESLALIEINKYAYNSTSKQHCIGVFFNDDYIMVSPRCLKFFYAQEATPAESGLLLRIFTLNEMADLTYGFVGNNFTTLIYEAEDFIAPEVF